MKTCMYILFLIAFEGLKKNAVTKSEYLAAVSDALKKKLLKEKDAFNLTIKVMTM